VPLGYRGEGVTYSAPMAAGASIAKGQAVAFDQDGFIAVAPAGHKGGAWIAAETKTTGPGEHPHIAFILHGIAGATASAAIRAGRAVRVGAEAGRIEELPEQAVDEGGAAQYTLHPNEKLGRALQDIAAGAVGDVFVGG
jgi:hypothetical protein